MTIDHSPFLLLSQPDYFSQPLSSMHGPYSTKIDNTRLLFLKIELLLTGYMSKVDKCSLQWGG